MSDFTINEESQGRVKQALAYAESDARKAYTDQRIPNTRDNVANALRAGIAISNGTNRYKEVATILMEG